MSDLFVIEMIKTLPTYSYPDCLIIQYAKAPIVGQVKTRLQSHYSPEVCTDIAKNLTKRLTEQLLEWQLCPIEIHIGNQQGHEFFKTAPYASLPTALQIEGDLGAKMTASINTALQDGGYKKVIIVGSDCVSFTKSHIQTVIEQLDQYDSVFTPAEDGGYVLIGTQKTFSDELKTIQWGQSSSLAQSLKGLTEHGHAVFLHETLWDVDHGEDVIRAEALGIALL